MNEEDIEEKPSCPVCGTEFQEVDGELICPHCDEEIDYFDEEEGDEEEEDEEEEEEEYGPEEEKF